MSLSQAKEGRYDIRKYALLTIVGCLILSALIGTTTFIFGDFGETELRILATVVSLGFFILLGLSTAIWHNTEKKPISYVGGIMSIFGFLITQILVWRTDLAGEILLKALLTNNVVLVGLAIISLLLTVRGDEGLTRYLKISSIILTGFTTITLVYLIISFDTSIAPASPTFEIIMRIIGSTAVIGAATTISTFILSKIN